MRNDLREEVKLADRWTLAVWPLQPVAQPHLAAVPLERDFWELVGGESRLAVTLHSRNPILRLH